MTTGSGGTYQVTLAAGMYAITAHATGYADGSLSRQVTDGQTTTGSIGLTPRVEMLDVGDLPRTERKSQRVLDERPD